MPRTGADLCRYTATELSDLLEKRELSPIEIVDALLDRINEIDKAINAFVALDVDRVRAEARAAEREITAGRRKSPIHGIPIAHKDIFDVQGYVTTAGSRVTSRAAARRDAAIVVRLRDAGAIMLGKTNTTEFAAGSMELFGETRNPFDLRMTTGTSSAGSAAAVAACMVPLATGSDTGGSIRIPAAYCGIAGLKPTFDASLLAGMAPFSRSFDTPGPMARCVKDIALFLGQSSASFSVTLSGIRIGIPRRYFFEDLDPDVERAMEEALNILRQLGAQLVEINLPHIAQTGTVFWVIAYSEALKSHRDELLNRHGDFSTQLLHRLLAAACLTPEEIQHAKRERERISADLQTALMNVNALVTPTAPTPATPIGQKPILVDRNRFTRPGNLAGIPALSISCGFSAAGLPIGLQLMACKNDELMLLRIAHAYEQSTAGSKCNSPSLDGTVEPTVILTGCEQSATESKDCDVRTILTLLHQQGFHFVTEELATAAAAALEPIRSAYA